MKLIPLTQGKFAQVDDEDFDALTKFKWYAAFAKKAGIWYAQRAERINGKQRTVRMHRQIKNVSNPDILVDHEDHNGLNNQRYNLRESSIKQNRHNSRANRNSTSKYVGVSWQKHTSSWVAQINLTLITGKVKYLGIYKSEIDAALAYDEAAKKYHAEFANLNFK